MSEQNGRHLPPCSVVLTSTEILTIRGTLRLTSLSSIWAFGACQEMICIDQERPLTVAGDLGSFQGYKRSLLECSALPGKDQELSLRRKAVFHTGNEHWQLQSYYCERNRANDPNFLKQWIILMYSGGPKPSVLERVPAANVPFRVTSCVPLKCQGYNF